MQDYASKDGFLLINLTFQSNLGLKINVDKKKNVAWGEGARKAQKSVTYFLNGPLNYIYTKVVEFKPNIISAFPPSEMTNRYR